jgi:hypothetical protein
MMVFDGDSVACSDYPKMVADFYHSPYKQFSSYQATTRELRHRLSLSDKAQWYICQIGQWSCDHQEYEPFANDLAHICKTLHERGTKIVLVTPPAAYYKTEWTAKVVRDIARIFNTVLVDVHEKSKSLDVSYYEPAEVICHFNQKGSEFVLKCFQESTKFYRGFP